MLSLKYSILLVISLFLLGCNTISMEKAKVKTESEVIRICLKESENNLSLRVKEGEKYNVYGPWISKIGDKEEAFLQIGDRLWQVTLVNKDNKVISVWVNAETGRLKTFDEFTKK